MKYCKLLLAIMLVIILTGCASTKKVPYMVGAESIPQETFLDMLEKEVRCFSLDKDIEIKVNKSIYQGFLL